MRTRRPSPKNKKERLLDEYDGVVHLVKRSRPRGQTFIACTGRITGLATTRLEHPLVTCLFCLGKINERR